MAMGNRYHRLRGHEIWRDTYTPPFILDRGRAQEEPSLWPCMDSEEWWRSPSGVWRQVRYVLASERGAVGYNGGTGSYWPFFGFPENDGTLSNSVENLSSAYVAGSTGNCGGGWGMFPVAKTLNHFYFPLTTYTGTAASVTSIDWSIRANAASNLPDNTGTLASGTVNPASNTGYIRGNSSTIGLSMSANTYYHAVVGDADGNATNFAKLVTAINSTYNTLAFYYRNWQSEFSSGGFSSRILEGLPSSMILVFSDGTAFGQPFATSALSTGDTNQKGLYVAGFQTSKQVWCIISDVVPAAIDGCRLWAGTAGPTGAGYQDQGTVLRYSGTSIVGACFSSPQTLAANTAYRLVFKGSTTFTAPRQRQMAAVATGVNSGAASDISPAMPGGGGWYFTTESAGAWVNTTTSLPVLTVYEVDDVGTAPVTPGGFLASPGMRGGYHG